MKKQKTVETKAKSQNRQGIPNAVSGFNQSKTGVKSKTKVLQSGYLQQGRGELLFLPLAGHDGSFILGKGPPGSSLSPGIGRGHPPENRADPPKEEPLQLNQIQQIFKNQNSNHYKHLIFRIMKNQFLILALFVMAMLAGVNNSYGQCDEDPLHPIANKGYDYSVTVTGWTNVTYQWFVTDNPAVLTGGTLVTPVAPGATTFAVSGAPYNSTSNTTATINITWASELIASAFLAVNPKVYYVVVKYVGTDGTGCTASNIKAYRIRPVNSFQLDLVNVSSTGTDLTSPNVNCISDLVGMTIVENSDPAVDPTVTYNYGVNIVYEKVTVRNFKGAWTMNVNYTALNTQASALGETFTMAYGTSIAGATTAITTDNVTVAEQTNTSTSDDEVIYLKLTYTHGTFENLTAADYTITVNGTDAGGNPDVSEVDCSTSLTDDQVVQTITNRPDVITNTTATPNLFIQP
ncbi:MAG: hypothetical protein WAO52_14475 [Prolixibacteraceae bacterium]